MRSARLVLLGCCWASPLAFACREPMDPVGVSHKDTPPPASVSSGSSSAGTPWSYATVASTWPRANPQRFVSHGHWFGRYDADIHVKGSAEEYVALGPGAKVKEGTVVAEILIERGSQLPGPVFAMEKTAAGWVYVETDVRRNEVRRGRLEPCVTCHAQVADQDELFGVPAK